MVAWANSALIRPEEVADDAATTGTDWGSHLLVRRSVGGFNNGNGCTSTPTSVAVGLGPNTTASAQGLFNGAFANGANASANATSNGNLAGVNGSNAFAFAAGTGNAALANGTEAYSQAGQAPTR